MLTMIDRHMLKRGGISLVIIIGLVITLVLGMDFILNLNTFLKSKLAESGELTQLIVLYYAYSLPSMISPLLPIALAISLVVTCAPMLKRGEFIALSASGVSLRMATRGLIVLALMVGAADAFMSDQLVPSFETKRSLIDDQIRSRTRVARTWENPENSTRWYANWVRLNHDSGPEIRDVIVASQSGLLQAKHLRYQDGTWFFVGPMTIWRVTEDGADDVRSPTTFPAKGEFALGFSPEELGQQLISRNALGSDALIEQGGHLNLSIVASRWIRFIIPLAMALIVLPCFVRFHNHDRITVGGVTAILAGLLPIFFITMATMSADSSPLHPFILIPSATLVAMLPGVWFYRKWRL